LPGVFIHYKTLKRFLLSKCSAGENEEK